MLLLGFRIAAPGMAWRPESGEKDKEQNLVADILRWAQWMRVARGYQLRIGLKDRSRETFDGFEREACSNEFICYCHFPLTIYV